MGVELALKIVHGVSHEEERCIYEDALITSVETTKYTACENFNPVKEKNVNISTCVFVYEYLTKCLTKNN